MKSWRVTEVRQRSNWTRDTGILVLYWGELRKENIYLGCAHQGPRDNFEMVLLIVYHGKYTFLENQIYQPSEVNLLRQGNWLKMSLKTFLHNWQSRDDYKNVTLDPVYKSRWEMDYSDSVIDITCPFIYSITGVPCICRGYVPRHPEDA